MRRDVCDHGRIALGAEPPDRQPAEGPLRKTRYSRGIGVVWTPSERETAAGFDTQVRLGLESEQQREQGRREPSAEGEGWRVYEELGTSVSQLEGR